MMVKDNLDKAIGLLCNAVVTLSVLQYSKPPRSKKAPMRNPRTCAGVIAALALVISAAAPAFAYNLPTGPAVPTKYEQCQALRLEFDGLLRQNSAAYRNCDRARPESGSLRVIGKGMCAHFAKRACTPIIEQCSQIQAAQRSAVTRCQEQVRAYQEHQRRVEQEEKFKREDERFLLQRAKGVGERVGKEAASAALAYEHGRRNIELGRFAKTLALVTRYAGLVGNRAGEGRADPYRSLISWGNAGADLSATLGAMNRLSRALTKIAISETIGIHQEALAQLTDSFDQFDRTTAQYQSLRSNWSRIAAGQNTRYAALLGTGGSVEHSSLLAQVEALRREADAERRLRAAAYRQAVAAVAETRRQAALEAERQRQATIEAERARQAVYEDQLRRQEGERQQRALAEQRRWEQEQEQYGIEDDDRFSGLSEQQIQQIIIEMEEEKQQQYQQPLFHPYCGFDACSIQ